MCDGPTAACFSFPLPHARTTGVLVDSASGVPPPAAPAWWRWRGGERRLDSGEAAPSPSPEFEATADKVGFVPPIKSPIPILVPPQVEVVDERECVRVLSSPPF